MRKFSDSACAKASIIASMLIWGSLGLFRRFIPLSSGLLAGVRALGGTLVLLAWTLLSGKHLSLPDIRKNALPLLLSGAFIGTNWLLLFEAYNYTSVASATLCYYMAPMIVMLLSPLLLGERLTRRKLCCLALSVLGTAMVSGVFDSGDAGTLLGALLGLAAACFYAAVILTNKRISGISSMDRTIAQLFIAALVILPYALAAGGLPSVSLDASALSMLIIVIIIHTGLAYALYFSSMDRLPAQTTALMSYIDPVSAVLLSALVLKESMSPLSILGTALVLGAVIGCELPKKK